MNYFKNTNNQIFAYDDEQVKQGFGKDMTKLESGEFYDGTTNPKPYNDGYVAIERDVEGNIIAPQDLVDQLANENYAKALADWEAERQTKVDNIEVTYNNAIYQGDEISQTRMARAITSMPDDTVTIPWVAKDNSVHDLTRVDLKAILLDAGNQQSFIWNDGRP